MIDFIFDHFGWILAALTAVTVGLLILGVMEIAAAERACLADGNSWEQTGETTIWQTHYVGKVTVVIPTQAPVYGCVARDAKGGAR